MPRRSLEGCQIAVTPPVATLFTDPAAAGLLIDAMAAMPLNHR
jgi:hypothetical protein